MLGSVPDFLRDPVRAFMRGWVAHGDVVHFRMPGPTSFYLLAHPADIKHVLQDNHSNYRKDPVHSSKLKGIAGDGLTMSEGALWRQQSRLMRPAFSHGGLNTLIPSVVTPTEEMLSGWERSRRPGEPVDLSAEMFRLSLRIVMKSLFDHDPGGEADAIVNDSKVVLEHAYRGMRTYYSIPEWLPLPSNKRFRASRRALDELAYGIIKERKASSGKDRDLVSLLLDAPARNEERVPDKQIRDQIITMILAGHDTTALALTWTLYLLAQHPCAMERARAEAASVLNNPLPTLAEVENLHYAEMVLSEALRLFPPAWVLSRRSLGPDEVGGYHIPAGSTVFLSPYITHRHKGFWHSPEEFIPERFEEEEAVRQPYAYFPFGGGPRQCIGRAFALTAAKLVLALVVRAYKLSLAPDQCVPAKPMLTLHPENNILIKVEQADGGRRAPAHE